MYTVEKVLHKWSTYFSDLSNTERHVENVNTEFIANVNNTGQDVIDDLLDGYISIEETRKSVFKFKNDKYPGFDDILPEVLKNEKVISVLHKLMNVCFENGAVPSHWNNGVITPIPKGTMSDPIDPSTYIGITLASCIYKVFCNILNDRFTI